MNIVFCLDNNFVMQTGVAITSICVNNKNENINFYLIGFGLTKESEMSLDSIVSKYYHKIYFYSVDSRLLENCPINVSGQNAMVSIATYLKLFIVSILPGNIDKILYLDGDLIVRHSLINLWNFDVSTVPLAAVRDAVSGDIRLYNRLYYYDSSYGYINTGVALFNLKYWRDQNIQKICIDYMLKYPNRLIWKEQDLINSVLVGRIKFLPFCYNVQPHIFFEESALFLRREFFEEIESAIQDPVILHYVAYPKPWLRECDLFYQSEWTKYQDMTEWAGLRKQHMKGWIVYSLKKIFRRFGMRSIPYRKDIPQY